MGSGATAIQAVGGASTPLVSRSSKRRRGAKLAAPQVQAQSAASSPTLAHAKVIAAGLGEFSKAGGTWDIDLERAVRDAKATLAQIDWSKPMIALWLPGSNGEGVHAGFGTAISDAYNGAVSVSALNYEASWHMRRSLPTGLVTMKLVLAAIAAQRGDGSVVLCGESQGAWIAGEAIADPMLRSVVKRAALLGHPWLAKSHYWSESGAIRDANVLEVNHLGDPVAEPIKGDPSIGFDALCAIRTFDVAKLPTVFKGVSQNPKHLAMLVKSLIGATILKPFYTDPHYYANDMTAAARFLSSRA